jgi:hypothetical protein
MRPRHVVAAAVAALAAAAACTSLIDVKDLTCRMPDAFTGSLDTCMGNDGITITATSGELHDLVWVGDLVDGGIVGVGSTQNTFAVQLITQDDAGMPALELVPDSSANAVDLESATVWVVGGNDGVLMLREYDVPSLHRDNANLNATSGITTQASLAQGVALKYTVSGSVVYIFSNTSTSTNNLDVTAFSGASATAIRDVVYNPVVALRARDGVPCQGTDGGARFTILGDTLDGGAGLVMVRYAPDLSIDPAFGAGGVVTSAFAGGHARSAICVNQSIWVAGQAADAGGMVLGHVNVDGTIDTTYGNGGFAVLAGSNRGANAVLDTGKALLVAGFDQGNLAVARFTYDAGVDTTFGDGGVLTLAVPGELRAIAQGDKSHYIAGGTADVDGGTRWVVVWLNR